MEVGPLPYKGLPTQTICILIIMGEVIDCLVKCPRAQVGKKVVERDELVKHARSTDVDGCKFPGRKIKERLRPGLGY